MGHRARRQRSGPALGHVVTPHRHDRIGFPVPYVQQENSRLQKSLYSRYVRTENGRPKPSAEKDRLGLGASVWARHPGVAKRARARRGDGRAVRQRHLPRRVHVGVQPVARAALLAGGARRPAGRVLLREGGHVARRRRQAAAEAHAGQAERDLPRGGRGRALLRRRQDPRTHERREPALRDERRARAAAAAAPRARRRRAQGVAPRARGAARGAGRLAGLVAGRARRDPEGGLGGGLRRGVRARRGALPGAGRGPLQRALPQEALGPRRAPPPEARLPRARALVARPGPLLVTCRHPYAKWCECDSVCVNGDGWVRVCLSIYFVHSLY